MWSTWPAARAMERVLARRARRVTGVDANPEAHEHARLKYTRPGLRFVRDAIESHEERCDALVFLQTIEHVQDPEAVLRRFKGMAGTVYVSTPNLLTLAPAGASKSDNPWHVREYRAEEFRALCESVFPRVRAARPLPRAQAARARARAKGGVGPSARRARDHAPVLRPLHPGNHRKGLRAAPGPPRARSTS